MPLPITDRRMTRFMITLEQGVDLICHAFEDMHGGEIYVKKIPSMGICEIAEAIQPNGDIQVIGIRPGEKLHEQMIGIEDAPYTYEYPDYFKILPAIHGWNEDPLRINGGTLVNPSFTYCSDNNAAWMSVEQLREWVLHNRNMIGKI